MNHMPLHDPDQPASLPIKPEDHVNSIVNSANASKRAKLTDKFLKKSKVDLADVYKKVMEKDAPDLSSEAAKVAAVVDIQMKLGFSAVDTPKGADGIFGKRTLDKYAEHLGKNSELAKQLRRKKERSRRFKAREKVARKQEDKRADALLAQINPDSVVAIAQGRLDNAKKRLAKAEEAVTNADANGKKAIDAAGFALVDAEEALQAATKNMNDTMRRPEARHTASPFYKNAEAALIKAQADVEAAKAAIPKAKAAAEANKKAAAAELEAARMEVAEADQHLKAETIRVARSEKASDTKES